MTVYLVPVGRGRFEIYSEAPDEPVRPGGPDDGWLKRQLQALRAGWHEAVHVARHRGGPHTSTWSRWRDEVVCRLAESIAEQRTLWALRHESAVTLVHPSDLDASAAQSILDTTLSRARRHHVRWLVIDTLLLVVSAVLALVPGPNFIAYYFAFRVVGHYLSWRGAAQALDCTAWTMRAEPALTELGALADVPRDVRRPRVEAIAAGLGLSRLATFFDRTAAHAR